MPDAFIGVVVSVGSPAGARFCGTDIFAEGLGEKSANHCKSVV